MPFICASFLRYGKELVCFVCCFSYAVFQRFICAIKRSLPNVIWFILCMKIKGWYIADTALKQMKKWRYILYLTIQGMTYQTSDWLYINDHISHKDTFRGVTFEESVKWRLDIWHVLSFFPAVSSERQTSDNELTDFLNKTVSPFFVVFFFD